MNRRWDLLCKMDVDDDFLRTRGDPDLFRRRGCRCTALPVQPEHGFGCVCGKCGARCTKCPGFGNVGDRVRRFYAIMDSVLAQIKQRVRRGRPDPGFVRLSVREIQVVVSKIQREDRGHWSVREEYVDLGPPLRIYEVYVVEDRRK